MRPLRGNFNVDTTSHEYPNHGRCIFRPWKYPKRGRRGSTFHCWNRPFIHDISPNMGDTLFVLRSPPPGLWVTHGLKTKASQMWLRVHKMLIDTLRSIRPIRFINSGQCCDPLSWPLVDNVAIHCHDLLIIMIINIVEWPHAPAKHTSLISCLQMLIGVSSKTWNQG